MLFDRNERLHVGSSGQVNNSTNRQWVTDVNGAALGKTGTSRHPHGQMSASRMAHDDHPSEIQMILCCNGAQGVDCPPHVQVGSRPPTASLIKPPVFNIPGCDTLLLQPVSHRCQ